MKQVDFLVDGQTFSSQILPETTITLMIKSSPTDYKVRWATDSNPLQKINSLLAEDPKNLLLIDVNVFNQYRDQLKVEENRVCFSDATETFKTLDGVTKVIDFLYDNAFTKSNKLIVVGGGITQDVGGFAAAAYKRGIPWVYFPTTLLSMCDSCIGAKTSLNYRQAKNQIALFSAPTEIIMHLDFLRTLTPAALQSGLGEILKLFIIGGNAFIDLYQTVVKQGKVEDWQQYKTLILNALSIKKTIIEADEFEKNFRKSLNLGHSLGHVVEALSNYAIPHGQAVCIGMLLLNDIHYTHGCIAAKDKNLIENLCFALLNDNVYVEMQNLSIDTLLKLLQNDKKVENNLIKFVMIKKPGDIEFVKLQLDDKLQASICDAMQSLFNSHSNHAARMQSAG